MIRESKYIIRRVIIGVLIALSLSFLHSCEVKAQIYPQPYFKLNNNETFPSTYFNTATYPLEVAYPMENSSTGEEYPKFNYLIIDTCTNGEYERFLPIADACNNSCFEPSYAPAYKYGTCKIGNDDANSVYIQLRVKKVQEMPETLYYRINNQIRFNGSGRTTIRGFYLSTEDELSALASGQKNAQDIQNAINSSTTTINNSINNASTYITNSINGMKDIIGGKQDQTNQKLDDLNNTMNDDSVDTNNLTGKASEWANKSASANSVSQMVTMPITLVRAYLSGLNGSCSPYNLGNLFGTDLIMPCIDISTFLGASLWAVIDILFSGFMIYAIGKKLVKIFNDFTNLKDNQVDELYGGGN